jgi:hypothetical protein
MDKLVRCENAIRANRIAIIVTKTYSGFISIVKLSGEELVIAFYCLETQTASSIKVIVIANNNATGGYTAARKLVADSFARFEYNLCKLISSPNRSYEQYAVQNHISWAILNATVATITKAIQMSVYFITYP